MTRQDIIDFVEQYIPSSARELVKERLLALFDAGKDEETLTKMMATLKKLFNGQPISDGDTEVFIDENLIEIFCDYYIPEEWRENMKAYMKDMAGDDESLEVRGMCDHLRGLFDASMTEELKHKCDEYILLWEIRKTLKEMLEVIEEAQENPTVVPYEDMQSIYFNLQRAMNDTISRSVHSVGDIVIYLGKMRNTLNELRTVWKQIQSAGLTTETIKVLQEIIKTSGLVKAVDDGQAIDGGTIRVMTDAWKEVKVGGFGKLSELNTTAKTTLVAAINEIVARGGAEGIKVWRTEAGLPSGTEWSVGDLCYNALEKTLYKRTGTAASAVEIVALKGDAVYINDAKLYVSNGTELVLAGGGSSTVEVDSTTIKYNADAKLEVGTIKETNIDATAFDDTLATARKLADAKVVGDELAKKISKEDYKVLQFNGFVDNVTITDTSATDITVADIRYDKTRKHFVAQKGLNWHVSWTGSNEYNQMGDSGWETADNSFVDISVENKVEKVDGMSLIKEEVANAFSEDAEYGFAFNSGLKMNGEVQVHDEDDSTHNVGNELRDIMAEVFPLTVSYASHTPNVLTNEVGTNITPSATINITRKGAVVEAESLTLSSNATAGADKKSWTANAAISSGEVTYTCSVTQGGQTKALPATKYVFTNYRYMGEVASIPTDYAAAIKALAKKELSTTPTLGTTNLSANKYYLFAVKKADGVNLVCREASSGALVTGCVNGEATVTQENNLSLTNVYSYILVPKSESAWSFKITNS